MSGMSARISAHSQWTVGGRVIVGGIIGGAIKGSKGGWVGAAWGAGEGAFMGALTAYGAPIYAYGCISMELMFEKIYNENSLKFCVRDFFPKSPGLADGLHRDLSCPRGQLSASRFRQVRQGEESPVSEGLSCGRGLISEWLRGITPFWK